MADNTLASLLTRNALGYGETPVLDSIQGDGITYDTADILRRVRKPNALADALRVAKTYVPENTDLPQPQFFMDPRAMSLRNALRGGLDTAANWVEGRPEIGPDTAFPLGAGVMTSMGLNAFGMLPKNSLGIFGGRLAKTADHAALAKAEELAAKGADRKAIWDQTGWFQGADGKWRFEIDDSKAAVDTNWFGNDRYEALRRAHVPQKPNPDYVPQALALDEYLSHPELKQAYWPNQDNAPNVVFDRLGNNRASYTPSINLVTMDDGAFLARDYGKSPLLHELQHAVQGKEGFALGSNPNEFSQWKILSERSRMPNPEAFTDEQIARELYRRTAGEVEARNVQSRMNMTPEERRFKPPWETEDVPADQQIIRK